jgi:hypothetical protein
MREVRVIIPEEQHSILEFTQDDLPGVALINSALKSFQSKEVFAWHLSIVIELEDLIANGMPSKIEREIIDPFGQMLDQIVKGPKHDKPNALFLARITWNATRELIWRVYEPETVEMDLKGIIDKNECPRAFDYRIDNDPKWKLAEWHLKEY